MKTKNYLKWVFLVIGIVFIVVTPATLIVRPWEKKAIDKEPEVVFVPYKKPWVVISSYRLRNDKKSSPDIIGYQYVDCNGTTNHFIDRIGAYNIGDTIK